MRWYISAAAVRDYLRICGIPDTRYRFDLAAEQLDRLCEVAQFVDELRPSPGRLIYRVRTEILGLPTRLELTVSTTPRPEGPLPQLVRVRDKDRGQGHR